MKDLKSMTLPQIQEVVLSLSQPKFRAKQIFDWMQKGVESFSEMKNIPKSLIDELKKGYYISYAKIEKKFCSKLD